jgi:LysM repeat protein
MRNRLCIFGALLLAAFSSPSLEAQQSEKVLRYIEEYKDVAIEEMKRSGVPASIKLAQGIFETAAGTSDLVTRSSNHFGIKCKSNWTGESVRHDDDLKQECFRKYPTALDSYRDHSDFLRKNSRYAFLFNLDPTDYKGWAFGLKKAGYATNTRYPVALIKLIEDYNLQDYTLIAMGEQPAAKDEEVIVAAVNTGDEEGDMEDPIVTSAPRVIYPEGVFKIHDTKVVFVKKGVSFLSIAQEHDVDLSKIFEFNEIARAEVSDCDQLIFLQRKRKTGVDEYHVVLPGETLHEIAQKQGIRLESLRELNNLASNDMPAPGEKLFLRVKAPAAPRLAMIGSRNAVVPSTH